MVEAAALAAFYAACITAVAAFLLTFLATEPEMGTRSGLSVSAGIITLFVAFLIDWCIFHGALPVFAGYSVWGWIVLPNLVIVLVISGIIDYYYRDYGISATSVIAVVGLLVTVVFIPLWNYWPKGQGNVDKVLSHIEVEMIDDTTAYPNTDEEHMVIVGTQAARYRADQLMGTKEIGTRYELGEPELQSVNDHMYYLFELKVTNWTDSRAVDYTVPGYILVDAEDPSTDPQAVLSLPDENGEDKDIAIKYWTDGLWEHNIQRYVYYSGYNDVYLDGASLEIDDNGRPFYTMTINKPVLRWQDNLPTRFLTVDAQTGAIKEYELGDVPEWVDRVYSSETAKYLLNTWGHWGQAPYKLFKEGNNDRYKVSGHLNLVYTEDGPAWQAFMTSFKNDSAVQYIALMDTRSGEVRVYKAPSGLKTESSVQDSFNDAPDNIKKYDPTSLALYKVYGELTWVASLVGNDKGDDDTASFIGIGVVSATDSEAANVIIAEDKTDAFSQYSAWIAEGSNNDDPEENAATETVQGIVHSVGDPIVFNESTYVIITLEGDPDHLYRGLVSDQAGGLLLTVTQPGEEVIVTFVNTSDDNPIRSIASFTNLAYAGVTD